MIQIEYNKHQFYGKLILQFLLICLLIFCLDMIIFPRPKDNFYVLLSLTFFISLMNIMIFIQLYFLPIGAFINNEEQTLTVKYLFRHLTLRNADIESFGSTLILTKSNRYDGILIRLKSGATILFSNFNLDDYTPILTYFEENNFENVGKQKFNFSSYYYQKIIHGIA